MTLFKLPAFTFLLRGLYYATMAKNAVIFDTSEMLKLIFAKSEITKHISNASSISKLKSLAKGKILRAPKDISPHEINAFFENIGARHLGVLDGEIIIKPPKKQSQAKIISHYGQFKELKDKEVAFFGGCFNGFHMGHWATLHKIKSILSPNSKLIILLAPDQDLRFKINRLNNPCATLSFLFQNQMERLNVLKNIPLIDYIIPIPDGFKAYTELINKFSVKTIFICREQEDESTLKHCIFHQDTLAQKHKKHVNITIIPCTHPDIHSSNFFKAGGTIDTPANVI